jgi:hypothetical protein
MISQLAREVFAQTEQYAQIKKLVSQSDAVRDTENLLEEIGSVLSAWAAVFPVIMPMIDPDKVEAIRREAAVIGRQLSGSRDEFDTQNYQQAVKLTQIRNRVDKLRVSTSDAWREYAVNQVAPYRELAQIAERLPKMARHSEAVRGYLLNAERQAHELPTKPEGVQRFHTYLDHLNSLLSDLEGLPSDVRSFLYKLMRGEATFTDVTQTVFDWLRAEGLADKLRITRL